jgi:hypothetical protein
MYVTSIPNLTNWQQRAVAAAIACSPYPASIETQIFENLAGVTPVSDYVLDAAITSVLLDNGYARLGPFATTDLADFSAAADFNASAGQNLASDSTGFVAAALAVAALAAQAMISMFGGGGTLAADTELVT